MSKRKTTAEQIEATKLELEENQKKLNKLLAEQKEKDRKARNHRLCKRGGQIEKLFPRLIEMTDEQFDLFVEKTMLTGFAAKIINQILPPPSPAPAEQEDGKHTAQGGTTEPQKPTGAVMQSNPNHTAKPAESAQNGGTGQQQMNGSAPK